MGTNITFRFKQFAVSDSRCGMKLGTDGVLAGALVNTDSESARIADIGAGCGIIALMMAQRFPSAEVDAIEIEPEAAADLKQNVENSPWNDRINVINDDFLHINNIYDLIVSNPPYFKNGELSPESKRATARHAGNLSPELLVEFADRCLTKAGTLAVILPTDNAEAFISKGIFRRMALKRRIDIATSKRRGITRSFIELSKDTTVMPEISSLSTDTDEYRELTKDFYLNY